ncbi:MAG: ferrous iron transport protein A [Spirochaetales bacterium]|nr:ferrous iron transport protein A [Spirochaetales bacterium]
MSLYEGKADTPYTIANIQTNREGIREFLFTLGCYPGENITIISRLASNLIISIRNARYSIDKELASVIKI